jgi:hypothetical protein
MGKRMKSIVLGIVVFAVLFGLATTAQAVPYAVGGTVFDTEGNPVNGVDVTVTCLETTEYKSDITGVDGKYLVTLGNAPYNPPTPGVHTIRIVADAGDGRTNTTEVTATGSPQIVNLILEGEAPSEIHDINVSTDYTGAVNGIKITRDGTDVVGAGENLIIGDEYTIRYKLVNEGDFDESIDVTVNVANATDWTETIGTHTYSLDVGESGTYNDLWNTTGLAEGDYTITVNASIPVDNDWSNNERTRDVTLEMPTAPTEEYSVSITADPTAETTTPTVNATYTLTVENTGTNMDNYTLSVDNVSSADVAELSTDAITNLAGGATEDVTLYVGNPTAGTFIVNVTVTSDTDPVNATDMVSTTTTVTPITITAFTVVDATVERGHTLNAIVTVKNDGSSTLNNVTLVVSGLEEISGYPLVGTGAIGNLVEDQETTLRMLVYVPASADVGTYDLYAHAWLYEDYPDVTKAIKSDKRVTSVTP